MNEPVDHVPESREVIEQRVRHLVSYVRSNLPEMFSDEDSTSIKGSVLGQVLFELNDEFSSGDHTVTVFSIIGSKIALLVCPYMQAYAETSIAKRYLDGDEVEDVDFEVGVDWDSLGYEIGGDIGKVTAVANQVVAGLLNGWVLNDINYRTLAYRSMDSLEILIDNFAGMVGLLMITMYVKVVEMGMLPLIECAFVEDD